MDFFNLSFWQGFIGNLVATIIGIAVGIPVAFWINRQVEADSEKENKKRILKNLGTELYIIHRTIKDHGWIGSDIRAMALFGLSLNDEGWRAFSNGGELQWIKDPNLLYTLSGAYGNVVYVKALSDKYLNMENFREDDRELLTSSISINLQVAMAAVMISAEKAVHEIDEHQSILLRWTWFDSLVINTGIKFRRLFSKIRR